jgi:hypothetical protein
MNLTYGTDFIASNFQLTIPRLLYISERIFDCAVPIDCLQNFRRWNARNKRS